MMLKLALWNALPNGKRAMFYGSSDSKQLFPERHRQDMSDLFELVLTRKIKPLIHASFPIDQVKYAHELLQEGEAHGQLVIDNSLV